MLVMWSAAVTGESFLHITSYQCSLLGGRERRWVAGGGVRGYPRVPAGKREWLNALQHG